MKKKIGGIVSKIQIRKSGTADTRSCDPSKVSKEVLLESTMTHQQDVSKGLVFLMSILSQKSLDHDITKIQHLDWFYKCFKDGFKDKSWWDMHRESEKHHLDDSFDDLNLLDVLEHIVDCTVAVSARLGKDKFTPIKISSAKLQKALENTVNLILNEIEVIE